MVNYKGEETVSSGNSRFKRSEHFKFEPEDLIEKCKKIWRVMNTDGSVDWKGKHYECEEIPEEIMKEIVDSKVDKTG